MTCSDSLVLSAFGALLARLKAGWEESAVGRLLHRVYLALRRAVRDSAICRFLWREGKLSKGWEHSLFYRIADWVLNLVPNLLKWIHSKAPRVIEGSFFLRLLGVLQANLHILLSLVFFVMLVAPHEVWNNLYGFMAAIALTVVFFAGAITRNKGRVEVRYLSAFLAVYAMFVAYAFVFSESRSLSFRFLCFHLTCLLVVMLMVSAIEHYRQLQTLLIFLAVGLVLASLYGCYQRVMGIEVLAYQQDVLLNVGMPGRVYSVFDNPNNFAEILVMLLPFFLALLLNLKHWLAKLAVLVCAVPCLVAIGMTYSRSGWIGLVLAVVIFVGLQNWRFIPLLVVLGLVAFPFLPQTIINRVFTIGNMKDTSTSYRLAIYEAVFELLGDRGVTGVGLGSDVVGEAFRVYPAMFDGSYPIHAHNNYLQVWCEMGIGGLISFAALLLYQIKSGLRAFYNGYGSREIKNVLAAAVSAFCGILVISLAEYTWFYPRNMFLFWLLLGVIAACVKLGKQKSEPVRLK